MASISDLIRGSGSARIWITIGAVVGVLLIAALIRGLARAVFPWKEHERPRFWTKQIIRIVTTLAMISVVLIIWGDTLPKMGSILALITAGVAVALQRVITSMAGYIIILRNRLFTVGDRITIGGVRGDVVALDFMQTTVLEMGQSPPEQSAEPQCGSMVASIPVVSCASRTTRSSIHRSTTSPTNSHRYGKS